MKLYLGPAMPPIHPQHFEVMGNVEEWTLVDKYVHFPGYKDWDAETLDEVEDESVDHIYNSHLLEHIPHVRTKMVLKKWYSKLKPGGRLTINVPDLEWLCRQLLRLISGGIIDSKHYLTFDGERGLVVGFYGSQSHDGEYHKAGFTQEYLHRILVETGFSSVNVKKVFEAHDMGCLIAEVIK